MSGSVLAAGLRTPLAVSVRVGDHWTAKVFGFTVNLDTILATVVSGLVVVALGVWLRRSITSGVPSGIQLFWETVVSFVQEQAESVLGPTAGFVVPLAVTLFVFILVANWLEVIPTGYPREYLPSPTADVNLTFAMSFFVIILVHIMGIRRKGLGNYLRGFAKPNPILLPINVIEEIVKPFTLALRLFGNLFAGGIMLSIIALLPWLVQIPLNGVWKLFDMLIGLIQAFIFALLTILYFGFAAGEGH
ncbi:MAG: F0F1 ATP synthase subunit A [Mycobacteriales bacterium]